LTASSGSTDFSADVSLFVASVRFHLFRVTPLVERRDSPVKVELGQQGNQSAR
jgi:hypothetical protein